MVQLFQLILKLDLHLLVLLAADRRLARQGVGAAVVALPQHLQLAIPLLYLGVLAIELNFQILYLNLVAVDDLTVALHQLSIAHLIAADAQLYHQLQPVIAVENQLLMQFVIFLLKQRLVVLQLLVPLFQLLQLILVVTTLRFPQLQLIQQPIGLAGGSSADTGRGLFKFRLGEVQWWQLLAIGAALHQIVNKAHQHFLVGELQLHDFREALLLLQMEGQTEHQPK